VFCYNYRERKRDGLNIICRVANHHADTLCVPAELHMVNEAVILEVSFCVNLSLSWTYEEMEKALKSMSLGIAVIKFWQLLKLGGTIALALYNKIGPNPLCTADWELAM